MHRFCGNGELACGVLIMILGLHDLVYSCRSVLWMQCEAGTRIPPAPRLIGRAMASLEEAILEKENTNNRARER